MSGQMIAILGAQLLLLLGVILLWLKKPAFDAGAQAAQERLAAALGAMPAELCAELAQRLPELSCEISAFAVEQAKLLSAQEKSLLQSLATAREQAAEQAANLYAATRPPTPPRPSRRWKPCAPRSPRAWQAGRRPGRGNDPHPRPDGRLV